MDTTSQSSGVQEKTTQPDPIRVSLDWNECTSRSGKKYYYNKRTKVSSWEKPLEMMTLTERADATTDWREVASSDGRKYYYNKITYQSTWAIPHEIKLARERANMSMGSDPSASLEVALPSPNSTSNVEEAGKLGKAVKM